MIGALSKHSWEAQGPKQAVHLFQATVASNIGIYSEDSSLLVSSSHPSSKRFTTRENGNELTMYLPHKSLEDMTSTFMMICEPRHIMSS